MKLTNLEDIIKSRRSTRNWQDSEVSQELLLQAIELATWAPNGGNKQNWYFYIILNRAIIKDIADATYSTNDQIASWTETGDSASAVVKQRKTVFFRNAPAAIAVAASQYQSAVDKVLSAHEKTEPRAAQIRQWRNIADSRIQSVAASIAYLLLVLHQMGLGAVWMTGPIQAKGEIEAILKVPADLDIIAFIPIGYPAEMPSPGERLPVTDICEVIS